MYNFSSYFFFVKNAKNLGALEESLEPRYFYSREERKSHSHVCRHRDPINPSDNYLLRPGAKRVRRFSRECGAGRGVACDRNYLQFI